jgi:hypothetical protein
MNGALDATFGVQRMRKTAVCGGRKGTYDE